jgi:TRAP-type mannitol/chloroaromatic compound transport system permease small subunit
VKRGTATGPNRVGQLFTSWLDRITQVLLQCSGIMIVLMALVYTYGSLRRYLFLSPDDYAYLGVCALMLGCVVFSLAGVQTLRKHITVDFVGQYFPKALREIISNIAGPIFGLVFCIPLTYTSWNEALYALHSNQSTIAAASIPTFPFKIAIPILAGLFTIVLITQLWLYLASYSRNSD